MIYVVAESYRRADVWLDSRRIRKDRALVLHNLGRLRHLDGQRWEDGDRFVVLGSPPARLVEGAELLLSVQGMPEDRMEVLP